MRSRRLLLVLGLITFAGSTAMLCVGTSIGLFVAGRIFQGMSAAIVWTAGLALLADNVEKEELGKCLGFISMSMSAGTFLGPLLGGVVYDHGGYYAVYAMAFALITFDLLLRLVLIERNVARKYLAAADQCSNVELQSDILRGDTESKDGFSVPQPQCVDDHITTRVRSPTMIWLLGSRRLLVALFAAMVFGTMLTSFDAVCVVSFLLTFPSIKNSDDV